MISARFVRHRTCVRSNKKTATSNSKKQTNTTTLIAINTSTVLTTINSIEPETQKPYGAFLNGKHSALTILFSESTTFQRELSRVLGKNSARKSNRFLFPLRNEKMSPATETAEASANAPDDEVHDISENGIKNSVANEDADSVSIEDGTSARALTDKPPKQIGKKREFSSATVDNTDSFEDGENSTTATDDNTNGASENTEKKRKASPTTEDNDSNDEDDGASENESTNATTEETVKKKKNAPPKKKSQRNRLSTVATLAAPAGTAMPLYNPFTMQMMQMQKQAQFQAQMQIQMQTPLQNPMTQQQTVMKQQQMAAQIQANAMAVPRQVHLKALSFQWDRGQRELAQERQRHQQQLAQIKEEAKKELEDALESQRQEFQALEKKKIRAALKEEKERSKVFVARLKQRLQDEKTQHADTKKRWKECQSVFNKNTRIIQPLDSDDEGTSQPVVLNKQDLKWQHQYEQLKRFKAELNHANVTRDTHEDEYPKLYNWIKTQRSAFKDLRQGNKTVLTPHRIALMNKLKFDWQPSGREQVTWEERLQHLEEYKAEKGHCNVPQFYKGHPGFGEWVRHIRRKYGDGKLKPDRIEALEAIGFQWRMRALRGSAGKVHAASKRKSNPNDSTDDSSNNNTGDHLPNGDLFAEHNAASITATESYLPDHIFNYLEFVLGARSLSDLRVFDLKSAQQQVWMLSDIKNWPQSLPQAWQTALETGNGRLVVRQWNASSCWWNLNRNQPSSEDAFHARVSLARSEVAGYRISRTALYEVNIPDVLHFSHEDFDNIRNHQPNILDDNPWAVLAYVGHDSTHFNSEWRPDHYWMNGMVKDRFEFGFQEPHPRWGRVPDTECVAYTKGVLRQVILPLHRYIRDNQNSLMLASESKSLRAPVWPPGSGFSYRTMVDIYDHEQKKMRQAVVMSSSDDRRMAATLDLLQLSIEELSKQEPYWHQPIQPLVLCHMDCQPQNLIFAQFAGGNDGANSSKTLPRISSVLDWEEAALADPRFELLLLCRKVCANREQAEEIWMTYEQELPQTALGPLKPWLALETVHSITSLLLQSMNLLGGGRSPWESKPDLLGKIQREIRRLVVEQGWAFCDIDSFR